MVLGALIDAGVPLEAIRGALGSLAIDANAVWTERVLRAGVSATKFHVHGEDVHDHHHEHEHEHEHTHAHVSDHGHGHSHGHSHGPVHDHGTEPHSHAHRSLKDIHALIDRSSLSAAGKDRAKALFVRLGEAEAAIHGTPLEEVHLHEVGALDSIIDIVGSVFALEQLGATEIVASPLNVGGGTIRVAHGLYPVPAPATLRLLEGVPIYAGAQQGELVTPTGALLVSAYARSFGGVPPMRLRKVGYGAGSHDHADTPNVLRVLVGDSDRDAQAQAVVVIECEIDDMNPQIFGVLMDRLLAGGALDVFYTSVQMKKNRPGTLLTIVAPPSRREALASHVFTETTTIGVRYTEMTRECLERETLTIDTEVGPVRFKVARRDGEVLNASPEFDDCVRIAEQRRRPVKEIQALAMKAYLDAPRRQR